MRDAQAGNLGIRLTSKQVPTTYYHMSGKRYSPGQVICANGQEKLEEEIEGPLEKWRPPRLLPRRDFVYCRPNTDFSRCGIVDVKYIYRVEPKDTLPQIHDLAWIGDMQLALAKRKYGDKYPEGMKHYPEWSDDLEQRCCEGYWSSNPTDSPVWEYLFPYVRVVEVVSDQLVAPPATKNGWPPP
jgi:hypothetical protein